LLYLHNSSPRVNEKKTSSKGCENTYLGADTHLL
jgi:hypothetical protein